jgi:histone H1/5
MASKPVKKGAGTSNTKLAVEVGAGLLAAAAAGYYFYGDKKAKKHRAAASKWAKGMKSQVLKEAKKLKKLDQKAMASIVDSATKAYEGVRSVDKNDLKRAALELKKNWKEVERELGRASKKATPMAKKAVKTAKKQVKKAVKTTKTQVKKSAKTARTQVKKVMKRVKK